AGDDESDPEATEVAGDPVSRSEAQSLGYTSLMPPKDDSPSSSVRVRLKSLPPETGAEAVDKLLTAWNLLKKNKIEEAMTISQEVAFQNPSMMEPKLVISRCFVARREYAKGLNVLNTIPDEDKDAEAFYYSGLCLSRIGKIKDALAVLKKSRVMSTDDVSRKRANDLILSLQGEQIACPVCGRKTTYDSMVEVEDRLLCATCAKKTKHVAHNKEGEEEEEESDPEVDLKKPRKKIRPPLTRAEMILRASFVLILLAAVALGLYLLYEFSPNNSAWIRSSIPIVGEYLPSVPQAQLPQAHAPQPARRVIPTLSFDSPELGKAMAGIALSRQLSLGGQSAKNAAFQMAFKPEPGGEYRLDPQSGAFSWLPGDGDAGKTFTITFSAEAEGMNVREQVNQVTVSPAPRFRRVGVWPGADPNKAMFMCVGEIASEGVSDLALFSGEYWRGEIALLSPGPNGEFEEKARADLHGRPAGAGIIMADDEKWLAVADYWNSRLRFFTFRDNSLSEIAVNLELPGRPLLAGFHTKASVSAVLCQTGSSLTVIAYRQKGQRDSEKLGEWRIPGEYVWRRLLVVERGGNNPPAVIAVGSDIGRSILFMEVGRKDPLVIRRDGVDGTLIDAAPYPDRHALLCLLEKNGAHYTAVMELPPYLRQGDSGSRSAPPPQPARSAPAAASDTPLNFNGPPPFCGMAVCDFSGFGDDLLLLGATRLGAVFGHGGASQTELTFWPLPAPARLFGQLEPIRQPKAERSEVVFVDMNGTLWAAGVYDQ
ncbi:MAG: hypothetical protein LBV15_00115, partial [Planctomycetota bacterium]|nr:hypothetical protein [Planctomycetota bacterium]